MITIRRSEDRGHFDHGWLKTFHTFSFADYRDPKHMGFRVLRVINEDFVAGGQGFGTHPHKDMEIITYVLEGALEHRDSMGNGSTIRPGDVQRMSAGTGVTHSEFNPSTSDTVHLLQIWILPERKGMEPGYEQKSVSSGAEGLRLVASPDGRSGSVTVHQDMTLLAGRIAPKKTEIYVNAPGRHVWIQVARGDISLSFGDETQALRQGDGASISEPGELKLSSLDPTQAPPEVLIFDLP